MSNHPALQPAVSIRELQALVSDWSGRAKVATVDQRAIWDRACSGLERAISSARQRHIRAKTAAAIPSSERVTRRAAARELNCMANNLLLEAEALESWAEKHKSETPVEAERSKIAAEKAREKSRWFAYTVDSLIDSWQLGESEIS